MPKFGWNKVTLHTSKWVFACKFAVYFHKTFLYQNLGRAATIIIPRWITLASVFSSLLALLHMVLNTSARHSETSATLATRMQHECDTSDTSAIRVRHE